jgi:hypothetical protein
MVRLHKRISDSHVYGNRKYNSPVKKDRRELWMHKYIMEHDKHLDIRYGNNKSCIKRCGACRGHIYMCRL